MWCSGESAELGQGQRSGQAGSETERLQADQTQGMFCYSVCVCVCLCVLQEPLMVEASLPSFQFSYFSLLLILPLPFPLPFFTPSLPLSLPPSFLSISFCLTSLSIFSLPSSLSVSLFHLPPSLPPPSHSLSLFHFLPSFPPSLPPSLSLSRVSPNWTMPMMPGAGTPWTAPSS